MVFIFGRKSKEDVQPKAPDLDFYETGKNGTVEQFHEANKQAVAYVTKPVSYDYAKEFIEHLGAADQKKLREGAFQAFWEGRPDNLLEIIKHPLEFGIRDRYVSLASKFPEDARGAVATELVQRSKHLNDDIALVLKGFAQSDEQQRAQKSILFALDQAAALGNKSEAERLFLLSIKVAEGEENPQKAVHDTFGRIFAQAVAVPGKEAELEDCVRFVLTQGVPAEDVQEALNRVLYGVVCTKGTEAAVKALLDVGAEANAAMYGDGYKGRILAMAVKNELSPATIEMLHKGGADFADALYLMKAKPDEKWDDTVKKSLNLHAEKITGQAVEKETPSEEILRQIAELRDELTQVRADLADARSEIGVLKSKARPRPRGMGPL